MSSLRDSSKRVLNSLAGLAGVRLVAKHWGPQGAFEALARIRTLGFAPRTVLDIGASDGRWTRQCLELFPAAAYFLADPLPENRSSLERLAGTVPRASVWHGAVGASNTTFNLYCHGDQSSFLPSSDFPGQQRSVEVRTLDSFLDSGTFEPPMLLKADVQGHELEVLKGARRCLELTDLLLLETSIHRLYQHSPLAHEVVAFAGVCGFRLYDICSYIQRPADGALAQTDLLFARERCSLFAHEGWK